MENQTLKPTSKTSENPPLSALCLQSSCADSGGRHDGLIVSVLVIAAPFIALRLVLGWYFPPYTGARKSLGRRPDARLDRTTHVGPSATARRIEVAYSGCGRFLAELGACQPIKRSPLATCASLSSPRT
jgi:hypothetical protein